MTSTPKTTSGLTGIAREEKRLDVGGRWIMQDYMVMNHHGPHRWEIATFMSEIKLISDGSRTVALITDGDDPHLETWRMVKSDDPAVAAFVEQIVAVAKEENTGSKLYERP